MYFQRTEPKRHVLMNSESRAIEVIPLKTTSNVIIALLGPQGGVQGQLFVKKQDLIKLFQMMKDEGDLE